MYLSLILCICRSQILINRNCLLWKEADLAMSQHNIDVNLKKPTDTKGEPAEKALFPTLICNEMET